MLLLRPGQPPLLLDPHIPNEQQLIALGLSGTPGPGQPARPVTVDRVLVDGVATYVQYHMTIRPGAPESDPAPTLTDDKGVPAPGDQFSGISSLSGWTLPPLPSWVPWHPRTIERGVIILGPLPSSARAAVLQFGAPNGPPIPCGAGGSCAPGAIETVRVPLNLRALARRRVAHPGTRVRARGLTLTLRDLDFMHVTYTCAFKVSVFAYPQGAFVTNREGRVIPLQSTQLGHGCGNVPSFSPSSGNLIYPPQRAGTRLT